VICFLEGIASASSFTTPQAEPPPATNSSSVVSKIKSWLTKPTKMPTPAHQQQQQQTPVTTNPIESESQQKQPHLLFTSSSSNLLKQPLSIDLIRKLKRPSTVPEILEYSNSMTFQGTVLEDWLMQTLDEYINNATTTAGATTVPFLTTTIKQLKDTLDKSVNRIQSLSSEDVLNEHIVISYETTSGAVLTRSNHSLPGTQEITPTTSVTSINAAFAEDTDSVTGSRPRLTSDSYKQAMQSCDNLGQPLEVNLPQNKRQEAKFYVQQILTDLVALGVLEFESGFENAINKTFKPKSEYVWGRFFAIPDVGAVGGSLAQVPGKLTIWPPLLQDSESYSSLDKSYTLDTSRWLNLTMFDGFLTFGRFLVVDI